MENMISFILKTSNQNVIVSYMVFLVLICIMHHLNNYGLYDMLVWLMAVSEPRVIVSLSANHDLKMNGLV